MVKVFNRITEGGCVFDMRTGWLVNNCLTCIPGTKTFWHDLLEWVPGLVDKTGGHTVFNVLSDKIENEAITQNVPDYIIRNATFFRRIHLPCKQISLLQDCYTDQFLRTQQLDVCNNGRVTVFNSNFTYTQYKSDITKCEIKIIPLGTDFNFFNKFGVKHKEVLPNSILFVGANNVPVKRIDIIIDLINSTNYNFCLVMKDGFTINHPRVKVFNKINHNILVKIYNSCDMLLCTSPGETQHLASIEAGACDLPIITTNCGALYNIESGDWGLKEINGNYIECIEFVKNNKDKFSPRKFLLGMGFDKGSCKNKWTNLIEGLI